MNAWNPITETYEDELEQHDPYLMDLHTDLAATAKGNANLGAPGRHLAANFSQRNKKRAKATGERLRGGGFMAEIHPGNNFFSPELP
jgi:hypothetical protein